MIRSELDPIKDKMYDYSLDTAREEHLYNVLQSALGEDCPPENVDYLCEDSNAKGSEEEICAQCFRNWAAKVAGPNTAKSKRLLEALELAIADKCPPDVKDYVCQATEDENTDQETCRQCIIRWATLPFGKFRTR